MGEGNVKCEALPDDGAVALEGDGRGVGGRGADGEVPVEVATESSYQAVLSDLMAVVDGNFIIETAAALQMQ
jgi:hypothetical protein